MDFEGEMVGKCKIYLQHNESTNQNQQNIIKTNKSKNKLGAIFGGDFRIRTKNNKIKLENKG